MLEITGAAAAGAIMIVSCSAGPAPAVLAAETDTVNVPDTVGVPDITPVDVFTVRPVGRPVALNEVGVLLAVIV